MEKENALCEIVCNSTANTRTATARIMDILCKWVGTHSISDAVELLQIVSFNKWVQMFD